ncbi:hypothetical protein [Paenibacillus wenxiniae]|uniref:Uncharacterized protein n=1 Tax=Paenibacillus wenxiniae TaxID=1636843 RepID=A0ABW4RH16_9BACL
MIIDGKILGSIIDDDKEIGKYTLHDLNDVCYVDMFSVNKNQKNRVPRFNSRNLVTTEVRTFEAVKQGLEDVGGNFLQMDTGLLVNFDLVKRILDTPQGLYADFGDGYKVRIADNKDKMPIVKSLMY